MALFKDLLTTLALGALIGGAVILTAHLLGLSIPEPHNRPLFVIGAALLSLCFRLLAILRQGQEDS